LDRTTLFVQSRGRERSLWCVDLALLVPLGRCHTGDVFLYAQVLQDHHHALGALLRFSMGRRAHGGLPFGL